MRVRIAGVIVSATVTALYIAIIAGIYHYQQHKAIVAANGTRRGALSCNERSFKCFSEHPVYVHQFSDVVLPTLLWAVVILGVLVISIVKILKSDTLRYLKTLV